MINFLQQESLIHITDNSGGLEAKIIYIKFFNNLYFGLIRLTKVNSSKTLKKSLLFKILLTGYRFPKTRKTGITLKVDKNECVLVKKDNAPIGIRIYKPIYLEFKFSGFSRICSLTKDIY